MMQHALEIRFDPKSESKIRALWKLAAEQFGTNDPHDNGVIPHMALLVGDGALAQVFDEILIAEFKIELSDLGFFSDGDIAFIHCRLDAEIFALHRKLYEFAKSKGAVLDESYSPENWVPHCTIAMHCERNHQVEMAFQPISAQSHGLIHATYPSSVSKADKSTIPA